MENNNCVFCKIIKGESPCHRIWEDENYLAFLTIFPNTAGFSVVIPKEHYSSYAFELPDEVLTGLTLAAKKVGKLLDEKLNDVGRTAMVYEGFGVDHVHAKLIPLHGTKGDHMWQQGKSACQKQFFDKYQGYICTYDCDRTDDKYLSDLAKKISS